MKQKTRVRISIARTGMRFSEAHKRHISNAAKGTRKGYKHSPETRAKMSESQNGIKRVRPGYNHGPETRAKMSASLKEMYRRKAKG